MTTPRFSAPSLEQWLAHLESLHPQAIDMGLHRVAYVRDTMQLAPPFPVIIVGGTNGKGSTCAMLTAIFRSAGYKVGTYTSPHIERYNERVCINGQPASDAHIVTSLQAVEDARGETSLTYFEFGTLAAMRHFITTGVDVAVMEVGLGGRLDAVNVFDPDVSAVVSVDLDHQAYLGDTREAIGFEKAGIYRRDKPAFCADPSPPQSLLDHAEHINADFQQIGRDFGFRNETTQWRWWGRNGQKPGLPFPALRGNYQLSNASLVIAILDALRERLPTSLGDIKRGLLDVELSGRFQVLPGRPSIVLDVAHNPHAARALASNLLQQGYFSCTHAILGMMGDKDIAGVLAEVRDHVDVWHVAQLAGTRAASCADLADLVMRHCPKARVETYPDVASAFSATLKLASDNDRIVAFGSFHTVADLLAARSSIR